MFHLTVNNDLKLCLLEEKHATQLFALVEANRLYLREWLPWLDANTTAEDSLNFIKKSRQGFADNSELTTAIVFKEQLVGMMSYHQIDWESRAAEIGYWLSTDQQKHGLITRACRFLVNYGFTELKLNRITIRCATGNHKSQAIPERLGFTYEGTLRQVDWQYDHFIDLRVYSILAEEWQSNQE